VTPRTRLFWFVLAVGVAASAIVLGARWRVESRYRAVEIVLDGLDWEALAVREGRDPAELLAEAARRGATSIALYERTLRRLADRGDIVYRPGEELIAEPSRLPVEGGPQRGTVYVTGTPARLDELAETFSGLLGAARVQRVDELFRHAADAKSADHDRGPVGDHRHRVGGAREHLVHALIIGRGIAPRSRRDSDAARAG